MIKSKIKIKTLPHAAYSRTLANAFAVQLDRFLKSH